MFADIEIFREEKQKFYDKLRELNETELPDKDVRVRELNVKFRDDIRKYLPTCLNIINTNYNCRFSIYKVGKDYDSSFNVIETNVKKTRGEIECELTNYRSLLNTNALTDLERSKLDLATEIILTYVDDPTDPKNDVVDIHLQNAKPITSSIISTTPKMALNQMSSQSTSSEIQYNPYANQPVNFDEYQAPAPESNNLNIFANMMSDTQTEPNLLNNTNVEETPIEQNSGMGIFFDQSYISQEPIAETVEPVNNTSRFINMMDEPKVDNAQMSTTDNQAMASVATKTESVQSSMDLGMISDNDNGVKKDINDLLAPMSDQ